MRRSFALGIASLLVLAGLTPNAAAAPASEPAGAPSAVAQRVFDFWTPERVAQATPRDLAIDPRGLAYLRTPSGGLLPYGHGTAAQPAPLAAADTVWQNADPASGTTIGSSYAFSVKVTDPDTVKSVSFQITFPSGATQSYAATLGANNVWSRSFSGFTSGSWSWRAIVRDGAPRGGYTTTSPSWPFTVGSGGGGGGGGGGSVVTEAQWTGGGDVQTAAGRILFQMPSNSRLTKWSYYVCSGTAVTDSVSGQSLILTAAHCVYDDVYKVYARNVLFVPNQSGTTAGGSDLDCTNDPIGCWVPNYGVVHQGWTTRTFPDNVAWDFGFYVVATTGQHQGATSPSDSLEASVPELGVSFSAPSLTTSYALGYSYSQDPSFRYCSEDVASLDGANWWLGSCGLSGGSSGGPWMQTSGSGPVFSVNSWGYTTAPGMAGPKFSGTSRAQCTYTFANAAQDSLTPTARGYTTSC